MQSGEFDSIIDSLRSQLEERLLGPGSDDNKKKRFLPEEAALGLFKSFEGKRHVKALYSLHARHLSTTDVPQVEPSEPGAWYRKLHWLASGRVKRWYNGIRHKIKQRTSRASPDTSRDDVDAEAERFWNAVTDSENARAKLLATLVLSKVRLESDQWRNFVKHILSKETSVALRLSDKLLPFKSSSDVEKELGGDEEKNVFIKEQSFLVCPFLIGEYQEIRENLDSLRWPWLKEELMKSKGTFGKLYEVKIAPGSFSGRLDSGLLVRKDVQRTTSDSAAPEVAIARYLVRNSRRSKHIVEIYSTIVFPEKISIIMPKADYNLLEFMREDGNHGIDIDGKIKRFRKLLGVAEGLKLLHRKVRDDDTGRRVIVPHLDFKPENILVFRDARGELTFKIADFGLSGIEDEGDGGAEVSFNKPGRCDGCHYLPPEGLASIHPSIKVTCRYDVWGFGGVCCDYLAWLWGGCEAFESLRKGRDNTPFVDSKEPRTERYFTVHTDLPADASNYQVRLRTDRGCVPATLKLNEGVLDYFDKIREGSERPWERWFYTSIFSALKEIALVPNPTMRGTMAEVYARLTKVVAHCEQNPPDAPPTTAVAQLGSESSSTNHTATETSVPDSLPPVNVQSRLMQPPCNTTSISSTPNPGSALAESESVISCGSDQDTDATLAIPATGQIPLPESPSVYKDCRTSRRSSDSCDSLAGSDRIPDRAESARQWTTGMNTSPVVSGTHVVV
ncbi:hypothetical protein LTR37_013720 [Vermiconidia calcicola]|uniref:Uncharacterized protein n=1 Tax=Vermiconidia calcicola TaxID=1690605 RepID=A0ACC3MVI4_9PEZI|nr:hypothetical protein LTR37_013720 [Vermiconidia calcicola]